MKILIINQYCGSPKHGMEYRHYYLGKEFIRLGHEVQILSGSYSHLFTSQPAVTKPFSIELIDGIEYVWAKIPAYKKSISIGRIVNMAIFSWRIRKAVKYISIPDLIIVSSPSLFPIINGLSWKRKWNCELYFEVRDVWPLTLNVLSGMSVYHPFSLFLSWFEKRAYKSADKVVSLLPGTLPHMTSKGMDKEKFKWIPNGVVLSGKSSEGLPNELSKRLEGPSFKVGYTGGLGRSNAMEYFIQAANSLADNKNIEFIVLGEGADKKKLQDLCSNENVHFMGSYPKEIIPGFLKALDLCYIGWHKNQLYELGISANKLFDYLYSGTPVLHSVSAFNDPVKESGAGISVEPEDSNAIMDAIIKIMSLTTQERDAMGERGVSHVIENYSYANLAKKYLANE